MTTTEAQTWFNDPVFRQQTDFIIVALDGVEIHPIIKIEVME